MRVKREEFALQKRGTRSTGSGTRSGYLQASELTQFSRDVRKKLRDVTGAHMVQKPC